MKIEFELNEASTEVLQRLMPKYGAKKNTDFFVNALHVLNHLATQKEAGFTRFVAQNPQNRKENLLTIAGLR